MDEMVLQMVIAKDEKAETDISLAAAVVPQRESMEDSQRVVSFMSSGIEKLHRVT